MLLQHLRNFEWQNEPLGVFFIDSGMKVISNPNSTVEQNKLENISQDTAQFFFTEKSEDFSLVVKWQIETPSSSGQCGAMVRIDKKNWAKVFFNNEGTKKTICTSIVNGGNLDQSFNEISTLSQSDIWYKIEKKNKIFSILYSSDNQNFIMLRKFNFIIDSPKYMTGAYLCNAEKSDFEATLNYLEI